MMSRRQEKAFCAFIDAIYRCYESGIEELSCPRNVDEFLAWRKARINTPIAAPVTRRTIWDRIMGRRTC